MLVPKLVTTLKGYHRAQPQDALGDENVLGPIDEALDAARIHLGLVPLGHLHGWEPTVVRQERWKQPRNLDIEATRRKS